MSDWADEIGLDICGPLPHARYVASALRQERGKSHIAGLREAAQILSGYLKAGNTAGLQTGLLQDSLDDTLARIAELEQKP